MFKKKTDKTEDTAGHDKGHEENTMPRAAQSGTKTVNTILRGSRLNGDVSITCDLVLSGEIEGNITSGNDSNIIITGKCTGNIETREGSVDISGELLNGNIHAGKNVTIKGSFNGGTVSAESIVQVDGAFSGRLEGREIKIGPNAIVKGELIYKEHISVAKGADFEGAISRSQGELKLVSSNNKTAESETAPATVKEAAKGN